MPHFDPDRAPFTDEQVRYLEAGRAESVARAVHRYRNQALVGFLLLFAGFGINTVLDRQDAADRRAELAAQQVALVQSGKAVAVDGCNRDFVDRARFRNLLTRLKEASTASYKAGRSTAANYQAAIAFYNRELREWELLDCRQAETLLTNDPDRLQEVPDPYYPGGPNNPPGLTG